MSVEHKNLREVAPGVWEAAIPLRPVGWGGVVARRKCRKSGGHHWHATDPMIGVGCCRCGARDDWRPGMIDHGLSQ